MVFEPEVLGCKQSFPATSFELPRNLNSWGMRDFTFGVRWGCPSCVRCVSTLIIIHMASIVGYSYKSA